MVWPARPMRCMPLATEGGASICTTRSIAPMSMPSSSEEVATRPRMRPGLQPVFDLDALRPRERAVVRANECLAGELVERRRQPLGDAAAVDEDQRGAVRLHELQEPGMDRGPDRRAHGPLRGRTARDFLDLPDLRHVLDRHLDAQVEFLLLRRVDDRDGPIASAAIGQR